MPSWILASAGIPGAGTRPKCPIVVEVDTENEDKDISRLDIELPVLAPRIYREYKNLNDLDVAALSHKRPPIKQFSAEEQRHIVFRNIDTERESHKTVMESMFEPNYQNVIGYFTRTIMRDLRLVGGFDVLFGKIKDFVQDQSSGPVVTPHAAVILGCIAEIVFGVLFRVDHGKDDTIHACAGLEKVLYAQADHVALCFCPADDEHRRIHLASENTSVRDRHERRRIDDHKIKFLGQPLDKEPHI
jgi:hypothetical protein